MDDNLTKFSVGVFLLFGLMSILFLSLKASNLVGSSYADSYRLVAFFDNVGGLKPELLLEVRACS